MSPESVRSLAKAVKDLKCTLNSLYLYYNHIGNEKVKSAFETLKRYLFLDSHTLIIDQKPLTFKN